MTRTLHPGVLARFAKLYTSAEMMGSAAILRRYVGLAPDTVLPLSISHGVDMNHCSTAMDVDSIEPLHWSYNDEIHAKARHFKASVRLPHPWAILATTTPPRSGTGVLVIGPPPGRTNDRRLLEQLRMEGFSSFDVLVKYRGGTDSSREFWAASGRTVKTAGAMDAGFYDRLFEIMQDYDVVVGCTLSSAMFYAAALGRKCALLRNYTYAAYETADYTARADFSSQIARSFVRAVVEGRHADATALAVGVLGGNDVPSPAVLAQRLESAIASVQRPFHHAAHTSRPAQRVAELLALATGRTGVIRIGAHGVLRRKLRSEVYVMSINEIDVWLNGLRPENFKLRPVTYVKQVTEPGWAADEEPA